MKVLDAVKPNYDLAWVRGREYIDQFGTDFWKRLREHRGWTREELDLVCDGELPAPVQELFEDYRTLPSREDLEALATAYETTPGALLDRCYEEKGRELLAEEAADEAQTIEERADG